MINEKIIFYNIEHAIGFYTKITSDPRATFTS